MLDMPANRVFNLKVFALFFGLREKWVVQMGTQLRLDVKGAVLLALCLVSGESSTLYNHRTAQSSQHIVFAL